MTDCTLFGVLNKDVGNRKPRISDIVNPYPLLGLPGPLTGLSASYGAKNATRFYHELMMRGALSSASDSTGNKQVRIVVNLEENIGQRVGSVDLPDVTTLNMLRLVSELQRHIGEIWQSMLSGKGKAQWISEGFPKGGTTRPDLIDVLHKMPEFKHIELFIYPVLVGKTVHSMATYFGKSAKVTIDQ